MTRQQFQQQLSHVKKFFLTANVRTYLFAVFGHFLVIRNLQVSYVMGKIVDEIDKHIKRKKISRKVVTKILNLFSAVDSKNMHMVK